MTQLALGRLRASGTYASLAAASGSENHGSQGPDMRMSRVRRVAASVILAGVMAVAVPAVAHADDGAILVSHDGVAWSTNFPGELFPSAALLIPGAHTTTTLWLKNATTEEGYLRVTLDGAVSSAADYGDALTVAAAVPSTVGVAVPMTAVGDCIVLLNGVLVPAGAEVPLTVTLALGNLDGQHGQAAWSSFSLGAALSQLRVDDGSCVAPAVEIPGTPSAPVAKGGSPAATPSDTAAVAPSDPIADVVSPNRFLGFLVDANSIRFTDGYLISMLFLAFGIGAGWFVVGARRKRRHEIEERGAAR